MMPRQTNRNLRNPYSGKSKSSTRLFLILTSSILVFFFVSILYFLATNAFLPLKEDQVDGGLLSNSSTSTSTSTSKAPQIAYAISLTSCSETPSLVDGAAILAHSIHLSSIQNPKSKSKYDYKMYAIIHQNAISCQPTLEKLGYTPLIVDVPVPVKDIEGDFLREKVPDNGCCGDLEFIKLWAYTLVDHPFVVHLDLDTIVLKPMDELYDAALMGDTKGIQGGTGTKSIMWPDTETHKKEDKNQSIDAFFTRDYNMRPAGKKPVGVQGGFLVLRPSMKTYQEFQGIIRKGDYRQSSGWGGKGYGPFYGSMTFQGIIPYFYDVLHPNTAVELNRCVYNTMADNPRDKRTVNNVVSGKCRDGRDDCEDCRERGIEEVSTAHFTLCQKPWECLSHDNDLLQHRLCKKLFHEWYRIRADFERPSVADDIVVGEGKFKPDQFRGFCKSSGKKGYIPLMFD